MSLDWRAKRIKSKSWQNIEDLNMFSNFIKALQTYWFVSAWLFPLNQPWGLQRLSSPFSHNKMQLQWIIKPNKCLFSLENCLKQKCSTHETIATVFRCSVLSGCRFVFSTRMLLTFAYVRGKQITHFTNWVLDQLCGQDIATVSFCRQKSH